MRATMGASPSKHATFKRFGPGETKVAPDFANYYQKGLITSWLDSPCELPIVYAPSSNIRFWGLEKLHTFDSCKFEKIANGIAARYGLMKPGHGAAKWAVNPVAPKPNDLLKLVHTDEYILGLETSSYKPTPAARRPAPVQVAEVTELAILALLPSFLTRSRVVEPMKTMAAGTVLAAGLAYRFGWSIHVGGGMHHAFSSRGGGWCMFDDHVIALKYLRMAAAASGSSKRIRALYIDLDAHQGNGVARDKLSDKDSDLVILDMFNKSVYPLDTHAKSGVEILVPLAQGTSDDEYLRSLDVALSRADDLGPFDIVLYNSGTDVLIGDPLGRLSVSKAGIMARDERVWDWAISRDVPIMMVLSGGYTRDNAEVVCDSLCSLIDRFGLVTVEATAAAVPAR